MEIINKYKGYAPVVVRIGISSFVLWFGINQMFDPSSFFGWLPGWSYGLPVSPRTLILINGIFETFFGALLILGLFTRTAALLLGLHMLGITFSIGYNDIAVRDFGLTMATISIFLYGPDRWSLDRKVKSILSNNVLMRILYLFDEK